jgi:DNA-binding transcriptional LysR family regulator
MELERLRNLVILAEELHFGRAARRLHITQPALSRQVKAVEQELRVPLFERNAHGVAVTPLGAELLADAHKLLERYDELRMRIGEGEESPSGELRIAYSNSAILQEVWDRVQDFKDVYPRITVTPINGWTTLNLELLRTGDIDLAFVRPPIDAKVSLYSLWAEEVAVALPLGHPLADFSAIRPEQLRDLPVILISRHLCQGYFDEIVNQIWNGVEPNIALEAPIFEQIANAVAAGTGVAVLDHRRLQQLRREDIVIRRFTDPVPTIDLAVAWNAHNPAAPLIRLFLKHSGW